MTLILLLGSGTISLGYNKTSMQLRLVPHKVLQMLSRRKHLIPVVYATFESDVNESSHDKKVIEWRDK